MQPRMVPDGSTHRPQGAFPCPEDNNGQKRSALRKARYLTLAATFLQQTGSNETLEGNKRDEIQEGLEVSGMGWLSL